MTSEATAPQQEYDGFVGQRRAESTSNPHDPRYGYMPPVLRAASDPRVTGFHFFLPGSLIKFQTFQSGGWPNPAFLEDSKARGLVREFSAEQAARHALIEYQAVEGVDVGFTMLPKLTGNPLAQDYFSAIHPRFAVYGHQCPEGLLQCPTCRIKWLESDESKSYFASYQADLARDLALEIKEALYDANTRFLNFAQAQWREFSDAFERTRNQAQSFILDNTHHHYRKCIHAPTFEDREYHRIQTMTASNAQAIGAAVGGINTSDFTDEELAELYAKRAEKARQANETTALPVADEETILDVRVPPIKVGDTVWFEGNQVKVSAKRFGRFQLEGVESDVDRSKISVEQP